MSSDMVIKPSGPDIDLIDLEDCPFRVFPVDRNRRGSGFQVVVKRSVIEDMRRYGLGHPDVEVCGVLVGRVYRDEQGPYLYAVAGIRGEYAGHNQTQVTFTGETWTYIQDEMDARYPEERIIGWYHTHPGFGVFLSGMDLFIHNHFFNFSWQVAVVYDPLADEAGFYVWKDGRAVLDLAVVEEDRPGSTDTDRPLMRLEETRGTAGAGDTGALQARVTRLESSLRRLKWLLVILALLALLWPIGAVLVFRGPQRPSSVISSPGVYQPGTPAPPGQAEPGQMNKATSL